MSDDPDLFGSDPLTPPEDDPMTGDHHPGSGKGNNEPDSMDLLLADMDAVMAGNADADLENDLDLDTSKVTGARSQSPLQGSDTPPSFICAGGVTRCDGSRPSFARTGYVASGDVARLVKGQHPIFQTSVSIVRPHIGHLSLIISCS